MADPADAMTGRPYVADTGLVIAASTGLGRCRSLPAMIRRRLIAAGLGTLMVGARPRVRRG